MSSLSQPQVFSTPIQVHRNRTYLGATSLQSRHTRGWSPCAILVDYYGILQLRFMLHSGLSKRFRIVYYISGSEILAT